MASYKADIIDYVEQHGGRANCTASEVADACGCSEDTVYRHWTDAPELVDDAGNSDTGATGETSEETETEIETETETETAEIEQGDLEAEETEEIETEEEDDAEEIEPDDTESKTYECGNCGAELEYLQKHCDDCGQQPVWSAIEG